MMRSILERDAERYAKRAILGQSGDRWTPFARKTYEDQRKKSIGYVILLGLSFYGGFMAC